VENLIEERDQQNTLVVTTIAFDVMGKVLACRPLPQ
jgi:hypothetical protein